jgi:hypothetical protein
MQEQPRMVLTSRGGRDMADITATVFVYLTTDATGKTILECFPNKEIRVPPKMTADVIFTANATATHLKPVFDINSIQATGANANKVTFPMRTAANFTAHIDNTSSSVDVGLTFTAQDNTNMPGGPMITGDSTIRNKGNSIFTWLIDVWRPASIGFGLGVAFTWGSYFLFGPNR